MKKILVIEDERILCNNIIRILKAEGFDAIAAENGLVGVQLAEELQPNLIICDIMMPEVDGYGVLTTLQQNPETATIPFIFLTAKTERYDVRQGIELGADDYITKPFDAEELIGAIKARFKKQELLRQRLELLAEELNRFKQFCEAKDDMVSNFDRDVRRRLSTIKLALEMLGKEQPEVQRERYLQILREEFDREITLLNQVAELQKLLTPENVSLLYQFNMLKQKP